MSANALVGFIAFLFEQEQHETLWDMWLAKDIEEDFATFKKDKLSNLRKKNVVETSDEQADKNIELASQFVKARKED